MFGTFGVAVAKALSVASAKAAARTRGAGSPARRPFRLQQVKGAPAEVSALRGHPSQSGELPERKLLSTFGGLSSRARKTSCWDDVGLQRLLCKHVLSINTEASRDSVRKRPSFVEDRPESRYSMRIIERGCFRGRLVSAGRPLSMPNARRRLLRARQRRTRC